MTRSSRPAHSLTCREAIHEVFADDPGVLTTRDVVTEIHRRHARLPWKPSTIGTYLIGLSANHTSSHHYPTLRKHAFLWTLGNGRYRLWDGDEDGAPPVSAARPRRSVPRARRSSLHVLPPRTIDSPVRHATRAALVAGLVASIHETPYQPGYRRRSHGLEVRGWPDRLSSYFWPTPNHGLAATATQMDSWYAAAGTLSERLLAGGSWTESEHEDAHALALEMLEWGRVPQRAASAAIVESVFRRALGLPFDGNPPMNSGWTKVAALATAFLEGRPDRAPHVIWDSRVSTSLVWHLEPLVVAASLTPQHAFPRIGAVPGRGGSRPRRQQLTWANAYGSWSSQEAGSELVHEIRDVLNHGDYGLMPTPDGEGPWTIRGVESVLFMDGY